MVHDGKQGGEVGVCRDDRSLGDGCMAQDRPIIGGEQTLTVDVDRVVLGGAESARDPR